MKKFLLLFVSFISTPVLFGAARSKKTLSIVKYTITPCDLKTDVPCVLKWLKDMPEKDTLYLQHAVARTFFPIRYGCCAFGMRPSRVFGILLLRGELADGSSRNLGWAVHGRNERIAVCFGRRYTSLGDGEHGFIHELGIDNSLNIDKKFSSSAHLHLLVHAARQIQGFPQMYISSTITDPETMKRFLSLQKAVLCTQPCCAGKEIVRLLADTAKTK